jgi:L-iditol 2-dehydrogenase
MTGKMKVARMVGIRDMRMEQEDIPTIEDDEVLVKIEYVGICGSDVHYYEYGRIGDYVVDKPLILGHECAGTVVEIGKNVSSHKIGDRVALEPGRTCGKCWYCKTGRYNLCRDVVFMATPPVDGAFAEYVAYPADMAFKLPDNVSTMEGALVEPLAVGIHAANQADVRLGQSVAVLGAGCIGLMAFKAVKAMGAGDVYMTDTIDSRLQFAAKYGAEVFNPRNEDVVASILRLTNDEGSDIVIETAGAIPSTRQTIDIVRRGGTIVLVGLVPDGEVSLNVARLIDKEIQIKTVFRYRNIYPSAIKAIADGKIDVKSMVTHTFDFDEVKEAFDYVVNNKSEVIKAVIKMG